MPEKPNSSFFVWNRICIVRAYSGVSAVVEEGRCLVQLVVEEDKDNNKILVVTWRSTRLMLGVDCFLQLLPPLDDGGGQD